VSPAATTGTGGAPSGSAGQAMVPFLAGTYEYSEPITTLVVTPGASEQDFIVLLTPGGFLRGVSLFVSGAGGVIGTGVLTGDMPWISLANSSIESIDGTPILYPMNGYSRYVALKYGRSWDGDPAQDSQFSNSVNPVFNLREFVESRMTIGTLPNTDARAQYRYRIGVSPSSVMFSTAPTTVPTLSIAINLETYAQPPASDYAGNPIATLPDGLVLQKFNSHEIFNTNGGNQILKSNRVGNLIRWVALIIRSSTGARVDLTSDPIRWRLDNTQLLNELRQRRYYENGRFWTFGGFTQASGSAAATATLRPTGVLVYPRYHNPGTMDGMYWLPTTEASYLSWELNGTPAGGTVEFITEDLAPAGPVPPYLMGI
jgi:hypothetical protein